MAHTDEELMAIMQRLQQRDEQQRSVISAYGVDLSKERAIDLCFWSPDKPKAMELAGCLERNEISPVTVSPPLGNDPKQRWSVQTSIRSSVDFITKKENVATFVLIADKYDSDYDGWGTAIVEAASRANLRSDQKT